MVCIPTENAPSFCLCRIRLAFIAINPLTPAAIFFVQIQLNLDILCTKGKEKVYILPTVEKKIF
jgi:hypothetical protein